MQTLSKMNVSLISGGHESPYLFKWEPLEDTTNFIEMGMSVRHHEISGQIEAQSNINDMIFFKSYLSLNPNGEISADLSFKCVF